VSIQMTAVRREGTNHSLSCWNCAVLTAFSFHLYGSSYTLLFLTWGEVMMKLRRERELNARREPTTSIILLPHTHCVQILQLPSRYTYKRSSLLRLTHLSHGYYGPRQPYFVLTICLTTRQVPDDSIGTR